MALSLQKRVLLVVTLTAVTAVPDIGMCANAAAIYGQSPAGHRAEGPKSESAKLWYIDVDRKGTQCLVDTDRLQFWRGSAQQAMTVRLSGPANFPTASIDFASGQSVVDVDSATFPVGDGLSVTISDGETGATLGEITIAVLAADAVTPTKLANTLKERGCVAQVTLLESSTKHPERQKVR